MDTDLKAWSNINVSQWKERAKKVLRGRNGLSFRVGNLICFRMGVLCPVPNHVLKPPAGTQWFIMRIDNPQGGRQKL